MRYPSYALIVLFLLCWASIAWLPGYADAARAVQGTIKAYTVAEPAQEATCLLGMLTVTPTSDPADLAKSSKQFKAGTVAVDLSNLTLVFGDDEDAVKAADGTTFSGPWMDKGTAKSKRAVTEFIAKYQAAGGKIDYLVIHAPGPLRAQKLTDVQLKAIADDPRYPELKGQLAGIDLAKITDSKATAEICAFNALMSKRYIDALTAAAVQPVLQKYPLAKVSAFDTAVITPAEVSPDADGYMQYQPAPFGSFNSPACFGMIGAFAKMTTPGVKDAKPYGESPFAVFRWEINRVRAIARSSNLPLQPWMCHPRYGHRDTYWNDELFHELIYHLALSNADSMVFFNPRPDQTQDPKDFATNDDDRLLDWSLRVVNARIGEAPRQFITTQALPWDCLFITTGAQIGKDKVLWRVTAANPDFKVKTNNGTVLTFQPGINRGAWYESKVGEEVIFEPMKDNNWDLMTNIEPAGGPMFNGAPIPVVLTAQPGDSEIHYTLDGSEPTKKSPKYTDALTITKPTVLKATAWKDGWVGPTATAKFSVGDRAQLRPAETPANALPGLGCKYYEVADGANPINVTAIKPVKESVVNSVAADAALAIRQDNYCLTFTGYIDVPRDGIYTFYTPGGANKSTLAIGDSLVVDNPTPDGNYWVFGSGRIVLAAGKHPITVTFHAGKGDAGKGMTAWFSGPGIPRQAIPATSLSHNDN